MDQGAEERHQASGALVVFTFMWAAAALFHQASYGLWLASPAEIALGLFAFFALFRPSSLARLAALVLAQTWAIWAKSPEIPNHALLAFFVDLALLLALLRGCARARGKAPDRSQVYLDFAPAARLALVTMYFWAAFHKLNRSYFDPAVSCAAAMSDALAAHFPMLPQGSLVHHAAIVGSILTEVAIPVMLCVRRWRMAGIILGALFHMGLALSPYPSTRVYNFSALLFALYFLFAPDPLGRDLLTAWRGSALRAALSDRPGFREALRWSGLGGLLLLLCAAVYGPKDPGWRRVLVEGPNLVWIAYGVTTFALFLAVRRRPVVPLPSLRRLLGVQPLLAVVPALVFLNGLSPYVGLKTELSFAMYSNLRTEGGATNHFLIGRPLSLFGFQQDLVTLVRSDAPKLQSYADNDYRLTWFEFRDFVSRRKKIQVTYRRAGEEERSIERAGDDPRLAEPWPTWQRKLLVFRPVRVEDPVYCIH